MPALSAGMRVLVGTAVVMPPSRPLWPVLAGGDLSTYP